MIMILGRREEAFGEESDRQTDRQTGISKRTFLFVYHDV